MIKIVNDGQAIRETNYWGSEHAQVGLCFLSWNAGAARVLLPDVMLGALEEMRTAQCVIVSRGPWKAQGGRESFELLFEDGSDSPYCLHLVVEQTDRSLPADNQGGGFAVTVWTQGGEQLRLSGKYRVVDSIPCLDPWIVQ